MVYGGGALPVFEDDEAIGTLEISREGLYTRFSAALPPGRGPGLTRLWILGRDGDAAPLALLEPVPGGRRLSRRLSRLELGRLPAAPVRAQARDAEGECSAFSFQSSEETDGHTSDVGHWFAMTGLGDGDAGGDRGAGDGGSSWLRCADGSLVDPRRRLLALPWGGGQVPAPARKISLAGREYLVFRY